MTHEKSGSKTLHLAAKILFFGGENAAAAAAAAVLSLLRLMSFALGAKGPGFRFNFDAEFLFELS